MGGVERKSSKLIRIAAALSLSTSACTPIAKLANTPAAEPSKEVFNTPISAKTLTPSPTLSFTPTPTPAQTLTRTETLMPTLDFAEIDSQNQLKLEQALSGEQVDLNSPLITSVWKFPWEDGQAFTALVWGKDKPSAIITSADCIYDNFREKNQLGAEVFPLPAVWKTNQRISSLKAEVSSAPSPIQIINAQEITTLEGDGTETKSCQVVTAKQRLQEFLSKIDWSDIPTDFGEITGKGIQAVFQFWNALRQEVGP